MANRIHLSALAVAVSLCSGLAAPAADATLTFYYDPDTGNVSFDTANTRSGEVLTIGIYLPGPGGQGPIGHNVPPDVLDMTFNLDNAVRLSNAQEYFQNPRELVDTMLGQPANGLYTFGDVLPTGLTEDTWSKLFAYFRNDDTVHDPARANDWYGSHGYTDSIGTGPAVAAEFIYGRPDGVFDNRWDLVDPQDLVWADEATLLYNPATGELVLDTSGPNGGHIASLWLESADPRFHNDQGADIPGATLFPAIGNQLVYWSDAIEPGVYSLGQVLDTSLTLAELDTMFEHHDFIGIEGFKAASFDVDAFGVSLSFAVVPEPVLAFGGFFGMALLRRRGC